MNHYEREHSIMVTVLLAAMFIVVFSLMGVTADTYASSRSQVTVNGYDASTWVRNPGFNPTIPDALDPGQVWAGKKVEDNGDGTFDITLAALGRNFLEQDNDKPRGELYEYGPISGQIMICDTIGSGFSVLDSFDDLDDISFNEFTGEVIWCLNDDELAVIPAAGVASGSTATQMNEITFTVEPKENTASGTHYTNVGYMGAKFTPLVTCVEVGDDPENMEMYNARNPFYYKNPIKEGIEHEIKFNTTGVLQFKEDGISEFEIKKIWDDQNNRKDVRPDQIVLQIYQDGVLVTGYTVEQYGVEAYDCEEIEIIPEDYLDNTWNAVIKDIPAAFQRGSLTVKEKAIPGYEILESIPVEKNKVEITNKLKDNSLTVSKEVKGESLDDDLRDQQFEFLIIFQGKDKLLDPNDYQSTGAEDEYLYLGDYVIIYADGYSETKRTDEGIIYLRAGESIKIKDPLEDGTYIVTERMTADQIELGFSNDDIELSGKAGDDIVFTNNYIAPEGSEGDDGDKDDGDKDDGDKDDGDKDDGDKDDGDKDDGDKDDGDKDDGDKDDGDKDDGNNDNGNNNEGGNNRPGGGTSGGGGSSGGGSSNFNPNRPGTIVDNNTGPGVVKDPIVGEDPESNQTQPEGQIKSEGVVKPDEKADKLPKTKDRFSPKYWYLLMLAGLALIGSALVKKDENKMIR